MLKRLHGVLFQKTGAEERVVLAEVKVLGWRKGERRGMVVRGAGGPGRGEGGGTIRTGGHVLWAPRWSMPTAPGRSGYPFPIPALLHRQYYRNDSLKIRRQYDSVCILLACIVSIIDFVVVIAALWGTPTGSQWLDWGEGRKHCALEKTNPASVNHSTPTMEKHE